MEYNYIMISNTNGTDNECSTPDCKEICKDRSVYSYIPLNNDR